MAKIIIDADTNPFTQKLREAMETLRGFVGKPATLEVRAEVNLQNVQAAIENISKLPVTPKFDFSKALTDLKNIEQYLKDVTNNVPTVKPFSDETLANIREVGKEMMRLAPEAFSAEGMDKFVDEYFNASQALMEIGKSAIAAKQPIAELGNEVAKSGQSVEQALPKIEDVRQAIEKLTNLPVIVPKADISGTINELKKIEQYLDDLAQGRPTVKPFSDETLKKVQDSAGELSKRETPVTAEPEIQAVTDTVNEAIAALNKVAQPASQAADAINNIGDASGKSIPTIDAMRDSLLRVGADSGEVSQEVAEMAGNAIAKYGQLASSIASAKSSIKKDPIVLDVHVSEGIRNVSVLEEKLKGLSQSPLVNIIPEETRKSLPETIGNLQKIKEFQEAIASGKKVDPPFSGGEMQDTIDKSEILTGRLEEIARLQNLMKSMTPDELNRSLMQLVENLDMSDKGWDKAIANLGMYNREAMAVNHVIETISKSMKDIDPDALNKVGKELYALMGTAQKSQTPVSREAVQGVLKQFVDSNKISLEQANQIEENFFARSEQGWSGHSRMLATQIGLNRTTISQLASVVGAAVPELSQFVSIIHQLTYTFSALGLGVVGIMTALNLYHNLQRQIANEEQAQIQRLITEGNTYERNRTILVEYQRAKNAGILGLPNASVIPERETRNLASLHGVPEVEQFVAQFDAEIQKILQKTAKEGQKNAVAEYLRNMMNIVSENQDILQGKSLNLFGEFPKDTIDSLRAQEAAILRLEKAYGLLGALTQEQARVTDETAKAVTHQGSAFREASLEALAMSKSTEELVDRLLKLQGVSREDLMRPLPEGAGWQTLSKFNPEEQQKITKTLLAREIADAARGVGAGAGGELDFQKQIERVKKVQEASRQELIFYARLITPEDKSAQVEKIIADVQRDVDKNPLSVSVQVAGTDKLMADLSKALNLAQIKDPNKMQEVLGSLSQNQLKAFLDPKDFDVLTAKLREFDAAHRSVTAQTLQEREQIIASYVKEQVAAKITLDSNTRAAQLDAIRVAEATRLAEIAKLPADAQKRMNEDIRQYMLTLGNVTTLTAQHLSQILQIQNAHLAANAASQQLSLIDTMRLNQMREQALMADAVASAYQFQAESVRAAAEAERQRGRALEQVNWMQKNQPRFDYYYEDRARNIERFNEQMLKSEEEFLRRLSRTRFEFEREWARSESMRQKNIEEADNEYHIRRARDEEDFQLEMSRMYTRYLYDLDDAIANRDAVAVVRIQRNYELQKKEREEDFERKRKQEEEDYQRRKAIDEARYQENRAYQRMLFEEQQALAREEYERQKADRLEAQAKQLEDMERAHDRMLAQQAAALEFQRKQIAHSADLQAEDRRHQEEEQLRQMARNLAAQKDLTTEKAREIFDIWDKIYGKGDGSVTKVMMNAFEEQRQMLADIEKRTGEVTTKVQQDWLAVRDTFIDVYTELYDFSKLPNSPVPGNTTGGSSTTTTVVSFDPIQKPLDDISGFTQSSDEHLNALEGVGVDVKDVTEDIRTSSKESEETLGSIKSEDSSINLNTRDSATRLGYINEDTAYIRAYQQGINEGISSLNSELTYMRDQSFGVLISLSEASLITLGDILMTLRTSPDPMSYTNALLSQSLDPMYTIANNTHSISSFTRWTAEATAPLDGLIRWLNNNLVGAMFATAGGGGGGGGNFYAAEGGTFIANKPTTVTFGEKSPELAKFIPLDKLPSEGGANVNVNVSISGDIGGQVSEEFENKMLETLTHAIVEAMPAKLLEGAY